MPPCTVDEFKFRMGYIAKPVRQRIVLHPWLEIVVNGTSCKLIDLLKRCLPGNSLVTKTEGMLRVLPGTAKIDERAKLVRILKMDQQELANNIACRKGARSWT